MPERIQRKRTKGWQMPAGAVYVGRPSRWGNPFRVGGNSELGEVPNARTAVAHYRSWMTDPLRWCLPPPPDVSELRGKDLVCWCPPGSYCHATVLLELANPAGGLAVPDLRTVLTETQRAEIRDAISAHRLWNGRCEACGAVSRRESDHMADVVIETLAGLPGVAVIQLPEPDENGHFKVNPDSPTPIRVWGDPNGPTGPRVVNGIPDDDFQWQEPDQAVRMAGVLLAAVAAAVLSEGETRA